MLKPPKTAAPIARRDIIKIAHHGHTLEDAYAWLKDPDYPEVKDEEILSYLRAENDYFEAAMAPYKPETEALFEEIKGRIDPKDSSVPWQEGGFEYRWAYGEGADYVTWSRRPQGNLGEDWAIILDENLEADGQDFFRLGSLRPSPDHSHIAYSMDLSGGERYSIHIRNLESGETKQVFSADAAPAIVWAADGKSLFLVRLAEEWRPYSVERLDLESLTTEQIFEEQDSGFFAGIEATSDHKYLVIRTADHVTAEVYVLPLSAENNDLRQITKRRIGHDYMVDHSDDGFYARSNKDHENFSLFRIGDIDTLQREADWTPVLQGNNQLYIRGFLLFQNHIVIAERSEGLDQIRIIEKDGGATHHVTFPDAAYQASIGHNTEQTQGFVRLNYSAMVTPASVMDYNFQSRALTVRKEQKIPSGYDKTAYTSERLMIEARDGTTVPVSILMRKDWQKSKSANLHLYGYGAYGIGMSPSFSVARLSLVDRGFAYAIAHIRGGDEMGFGWYRAGKLKDRENTFNDFVDVAKGLIKQGYSGKGRISISGGSAGGELMGAVLNQAPDLFGAAVMHVPFVDVLNTMLDKDLPLTPLEWPEWGNPIEDAKAYDTIKAYCPYTNILVQDYPPMLVTGGLSDPRVTYWEPAKWTAKLRHLKTDANILLMKINMTAGHAGKSGRYEYLKEVAEEYSFILNAL